MIKEIQLSCSETYVIGTFDNLNNSRSGIIYYPLDGVFVFKKDYITDKDIPDYTLLSEEELFLCSVNLNFEYLNEGIEFYISLQKLLKDTKTYVRYEKIDLEY